MAAIYVATRSVTRTYADVGERPWGISLSPDGKTIYTANGPGAESLIDIATGCVKKIATDGSPWGEEGKGGGGEGEGGGGGGEGREEEGGGGGGRGRAEEERTLVAVKR